jgi:hypothetical protein
MSPGVVCHPQASAPELCLTGMAPRVVDDVCRPCSVGAGVVGPL